jgi:glycosyltransferase involved in cell wall biosynthesis
LTNFSVLISVYIKENPVFLKNCLDSIFNQSVKPTEVILVKDGLLNESLNKVIDFYSKDHTSLKIYGYKENKGLGYALSFGLKKCNYDIVVRCDSDDINDLNRFEQQVEIIKKSNFAISGTNIEEFDFNPGDANRFRNLPQFNLDIQRFKFSRNPFNHMTVVFRKNIILSAGGYMDMPGYEDYYLWLRVLKNHEGYNIQKPLVHARVGNDMIGRRQGYEFMKKEIKFQKQIFEEGLISKTQLYNNIFKRVLPRLLPKMLLLIIYKLFLRQ